MIPARLQWYVLREMLRVALISAVALTAVIFVGMSLSLMRRGLNVLQLYSVLPYAATMSLPYALPCAFLLGSVFVFGRLSGSNEINAIRCSGVNLNSVIFPPLILALMVCGGTFYLNHYLLPWSLNHVRTAGKELVGEYLGTLAGGKVQKIGRYSVYIGSIDERTRVWHNVAVIEFVSSFPVRVIRANEGSFAMSEDNTQVALLLKDVDIYHPVLNDTEKEKPSHFGQLKLTIPLYGDDDKDSSDVRPKYLPLTDWMSDKKAAPAPVAATPAARAPAAATAAGPTAAAAPSAAAAAKQARQATPTNLIELRARLAKTMAEKRRAGAYNGVKRPKSRRKQIEKATDTANRSYTTLKREQTLRQTRLEAARTAVAQAQTLVASTQTARDQQARQVQEAKTRLEDLQRQIDDLATQRKEAEQGEGAEAQLAGIDQESATLTKQASDVQDRFKAVTASLDKAQGEWTAATTKRDEKVAAQETARKFAEELDDKVKQALAQYTLLRQQCDNLRTWEMYLEADSDFESRNAGSMATFVFVLMGIPLGILSRRGNVIMAFLLSFGAVLAVYYPLAMIGQMLDSDAFLPARIAEWAPNIAVGAMGLGLMIWGVRR